MRGENMAENIPTQPGCTPLMLVYRGSNSTVWNSSEHGGREFDGET